MARKTHPKQEDVQKLIGAKSQPILSRLSAIFEILREANLKNTMKLKPELVMCHPANRGKLGLNAYNAHRTGKFVKNIGAKIEELLGAVCIGVASDPKRKAEQTSFNLKLVECSAGLLSPTTGAEKFCSVGGGTW